MPVTAAENNSALNPEQTLLVFGATGQTGRHFTELALQEGHGVRVLVRNPGKLAARTAGLEVHEGSITESLDLDRLLDGVGAVVAMLGDMQAQREHQINTTFVQGLIPAMRRRGVARFFYQAGGLSAPPDGTLSPLLRTIRSTVARGYIGQHRDNEAVMRYFSAQAMDIEWIVHRAGIGSDGPSKGVLERSKTNFSVATFGDCASYSYRVLSDPDAIHTCDLSHYREG